MHNKTLIVLLILLGINSVTFKSLAQDKSKDSIEHATSFFFAGKYRDAYKLYLDVYNKADTATLSNYPYIYAAAAAVKNKAPDTALKMLWQYVTTASYPEIVPLFIQPDFDGLFKADSKKKLPMYIKWSLEKS